MIIHPSIQQDSYILSISEQKYSPEFIEPLILYQFQKNTLTMFTLYSEKIQPICDPFYTKNETIDTPYN